MPVPPRIWVMGASGSGKSTLASEIGALCGHKVIDLDELHWLPDWQTRPHDELLDLLQSSTKGANWVIAGNYRRVQPHFLPLANMIVWLDYNFPLVFWRLARRSVRRASRGEKCCNGNRETLQQLLSRDSVVLWLLKTYRARHQDMLSLTTDARFSHLEIVRIRSPRELRKWLLDWKTKTARN